MLDSASATLDTAGDYSLTLLGYARHLPVIKQIGDTMSSAGGVIKGAGRTLKKRLSSSSLGSLSSVSSASSLSSDVYSRSMSRNTSGSSLSNGSGYFWVEDEGDSAIESQFNSVSRSTSPDSGRATASPTLEGILEEGEDSEV